MTAPRRHRNHRHYAYAHLSPREYATVTRLATRDKLSIANFVRRAINSVLIEEGLEDELVKEQPQGRPPGRGARV